jgi:hypothetical protein
VKIGSYDAEATHEERSDLRLAMCQLMFVSQADPRQCSYKDKQYLRDEVADA